MRYPNPNDADEVYCYTCSDAMLPEFAVKRGDTWDCVFCVLDDRDYRLSLGESVDPLPPRVRRLVRAQIERLSAALRYPIGSE